VEGSALRTENAQEAVSTQAPAQQDALPQSLPHAPQFFGSLVGSTHVAPQAAWGALHGRLLSGAFVQ
jgi:hypothetical protein